MSSIPCDRTRALISSALDGRLHELERRFLDAHLLRCDECRSFADDTAWFTDLIRTAPLEPAPPIMLPRRRSRVQLRSVASVASVAAVLVVAVNVALTTQPRHETSEQSLVAAALTPGPVGAESVRALLRADLASGRLSVGSDSEANLGEVKPVLPPRSQ